MDKTISVIIYINAPALCFNPRFPCECSGWGDGDMYRMEQVRLPPPTRPGRSWDFFLKVEQAKEVVLSSY